jgi:hypothetical protein
VLEKTSDAAAAKRLKQMIDWKGHNARIHPHAGKSKPNEGSLAPSVDDE